jgi:hypothetical protein
VAVHLLEPAVPTLDVPRMHPCGAFMDQQGELCGATPSLLSRRVCLHGHARDVYLCAVHEAVVKGTAAAACRDCAGLGRWSHRCPVALVSVPEALDLIRAQVS